MKDLPDDEFGVIDGGKWVWFEFDENNILVENKDKLYLKRLEGNNFWSANVSVKNIFILRKNSSPKTQIVKLKKSVAIKLFLDLQTNLPTSFFKAKYMLIKSILDKCDVFTVKYNDICDIDVLLKQVATNNYKIYLKKIKCIL